ncbi:hypothetical protein [Nocardia beijingensis]|uniref:hypothetical protein n=1 Tax=Nocardia beijingensis TaxID=95162 RepID=UPI003F4EEBDA
MTRRVQRIYPDTIADVRVRLAQHIRTVGDPRIDDDEAEGVLRAGLAWSPQGGRVLDEHLAAHPDAFHAPDPGFPTVFNRVAHALADRGYHVVLSRCVGCGETARKFDRFTAEGRLCKGARTGTGMPVAPRRFAGVGFLVRLFR